MRELLKERLHDLDPDLANKEKLLKSNHLFFKLLGLNILKHSKYLENTNRKNGVSAITPMNIKRIVFGTFMKQPLAWRNVSREFSFVIISYLFILGARHGRLLQVKERSSPTRPRQELLLRLHSQERVLWDLKAMAAGSLLVSRRKDDPVNDKRA